MALNYTILTQDGMQNTGNDGARDRYFAAGNRDGIMKGSLNEGKLIIEPSNGVVMDTCVLLICGNPVILNNGWNTTFVSKPSTNERHSIVAQLTVDNNNHKTFDILVLPVTTKLVKDNLFKTLNVAGTYQVEIGRFTLTTNSNMETQVKNLTRTIDVITGGGTVDSELHWGTITAYGLGHNEDPEADFEQRYDEEQGFMVTDVSLGIPSGSIDNLDDTLSSTSHNAIENQAVENNKMDKSNPTGTGSFSLNRRENTIIGEYSTAEGITCEASGRCSHAEGGSCHAIGTTAHAEGSGTQANGNNSHAEGAETEANGLYSHAEGDETIANRYAQHTFGSYNIVDTHGENTNAKGKYIEIVGNGTANNARSNARTLDWDGNEWIAGRHRADGGYTDGNNANYSAKLPDTTGWTGNKTIAMTDLLPVGSLIAYVGSTAPTGWLWCNGSTFNQADYPELYSVLGTNVLPDMNHCFPEGTSTASEIYSGTNTQPIAAGLPNIKGEFLAYTYGTGGPAGALTSSTSSNNVLNSGNQGNYNYKKFNFNAHNSNNIYDDNITTVQPKSYRFMYIIKGV